MKKPTNLVSPPSVLFLFLFLFLLLLLLPACHAAIQCSDMINDLVPCVKFLSSGTGVPSTQCCVGATNLASAATTSADRQSACTCLLPAAKKMQTSEATANALASSCGISLPFSLSYNIDCSKIS